MITTLFTYIRRILSVFLMLVMFVGSTFFGGSDKTLNSVKGIQEVTDGLYMMDCTYDYNLDYFLENGVSTHAELLAEVLAKTLFSGIKAPACTTFNSITSEGDHLFSRNFDYMDSDLILVWTHPEDGYASISSVCSMFNLYSDDFNPSNATDRAFSLIAPYAPFDGMNEKGLSIAILELEKAPTFQTTDRLDLTTTMMIRAVLDKAATLEEAVEIFEKYDMHDPLFTYCTYHYQIADASGKTAIIEYVDNEMKIIYPEQKQDNKANYLVAANYFITEGVDDPRGMGQDRAEKVYNALDNSKGVTTESQAMSILQSVSIENEDLHGYTCSTIWSDVFNQTNKTVDICVHNDFSKVYTFSVFEPQVVK